MTDEPQPPPSYEAFETGDEPGFVEKATENVKEAAHNAQAVYARARQPGMPLSILSNIAREAPLGSLLAAFLLGVAIARRR